MTTPAKSNGLFNGPDEGASNRSGSSLVSPLFESIVNAANAAPSADNNQPWMFEPFTDGFADGLNLYWDRSRCLPSDVDGMFDLLSLGACVENVTQTLTSLGRTAAVHLLDPFKQSDSAEGCSLPRVAEITFVDGSDLPPGEGLSSYIADRCTNRFPFSTDRIAAETLDEIRSGAIQNETAKLVWEEDRETIKQISSLVSLSDSLRFRYQPFHEELHRQLRLTAEHADQSGDGLDYRTLGLPPGGRWVLRSLKPWGVMSFLNRFGMASMLAAPSKRLVRQCGAIGFIYLKDRSPQSMIEGGRAFQRMWLEATKHGLAVHPLGSLPIFLANESMPSELVPIVDRVRATAQSLLPSPDRFLQMAFRIGVVNRSAATKSQRRTLDDVTMGASKPSPLSSQVDSDNEVQ